MVLDACVTGRGRIQDGEGMAGLRQAFQLAGAETVVSTLWEIPAKDHTPALTRAFWANIDPRRDKAEVLRQAQLEILGANGRAGAELHPSYWAAFTVTGVPFAREGPPRK